jgi:hypothetical protein
MKNLLRKAALLATTATAQDIACTEEDGNSYCQPVNAITYTSVGGQGSYNRIIDMDSTSGSCSSTPYGYSGSLAPLNEEVCCGYLTVEISPHANSCQVSWHVRGPTILKQFAAYTPGSPTTKKSWRSDHLRWHGQGHAAHKHHANKVQERQVGATVSAVIDGVMEHWINEYDGTPSETTSSSDVASDTPAPSSTGSSMSSAYGNTTTGSGWGRNAYFNADTQTTTGLVFLNHFGGSCSGVFDYTFGNSLSYASSDGTCGASSPQTLQCTTLPSSAEVVLMRDQQCEDDDCGYTRPGTVAYHGWDGARKAFFFEFQMPNDGSTTTDVYNPVNMPAIWVLNAQIPRTLQYGNQDCSCWGSGCGEFDMFEVLSPGSSKAKSTLHGNKAGGDSNYFDRPEQQAIKLGMVLFDDNAHIKILDPGMEFPSVSK